MSESAMDVVEIMARSLCSLLYAGEDDDAKFIVENTWRDYLEDVDIALRAAYESGFVLVPKEATQNQCDAAFIVTSKLERENSGAIIPTADNFVGIWSAMIAASVKGGGT